MTGDAWIVVSLAALIALGLQLAIRAALREVAAEIAALREAIIARFPEAPSRPRQPQREAGADPRS